MGIHAAVFHQGNHDDGLHHEEGVLDLSCWAHDFDFGSGEIYGMARARKELCRALEEKGLLGKDEMVLCKKDHTYANELTNELSYGLRIKKGVYKGTLPLSLPKPGEKVFMRIVKV